MHIGGRLFYKTSNRCSDMCKTKSFAPIQIEKKCNEDLTRFLCKKTNFSTTSATASENLIDEKKNANRAEKMDKNSSADCLHPRKKFSRFESTGVIFEGWTQKMAGISEQVTRNFATASSATASTILPEMPEPRGLPLIGTTLDLIRAGGAARLHEYVDKRHKELGPVYREQLGWVKAVFVSSPNEYRRIFRLEGSKPKHLLPEAWTLYNEMRKCQRGLFFMEGDEWLHYRRIMNKLLLKPDAEKFMTEPCKQAANTLAAECNFYAKKGIAIPKLEGKLYLWSIEAMLAILVGSKWPDHRKNMLPRAEKLADNLHNIFYYSGKLSLLPVKLAMNLKLPLWNKFVASVDNALEIIKDLVKEMMKLDEVDGLVKIFADEGIRDDNLVRIVADLISAAGDTTAYSMQWALFLLSTHPNIQEELFENLKNVNDADMTQQIFLKSVIKETLRMYPAAPFVTRFLPEDSTVGGYHVAKGDLILLSLYTSGRDENNFTNAQNFSPDRWLRNEKGDYKGVINPHASLPFALGARSCIGKKIAEIKLTLTIAALIKNFKMECINGDDIKMILHLVAVPSQPIQLLMKSRN